MLKNKGPSTKFKFTILIFIIHLAVALTLRAVVLVAGAGFSIKLLFSREKLRPFECGFSPKFRARLPFSMRYFLLTLVFLVFDVELVLIFPFLSSYPGADYIIGSALLIRFLLLLFLGVIYEWNQGTLDWAV